MIKKQKKESVHEAIVRRMFVAIYHTIAVENMRGFKTFCDENNIARTHLNKIKINPSRKFDLTILNILVTKYNFSAHWIITGDGEMKSIINNTTKVQKSSNTIC